jgi:hypothetical protein
MKPTSDFQAATSGVMMRRLLPFLMLLYLIAYIEGRAKHESP